MDGDPMHNEVPTSPPSLVEVDELVLSPRGDRQAPPMLDADYEDLAALREAIGAAQDRMYVGLTVDFIRQRLRGDPKTTLHLARRRDKREALSFLLGEQDARALLRQLWRLSQRFAQPYIAKKPLMPVAPSPDGGCELTGYGALVYSRAVDVLRGARFVDFGLVQDRTRVARQMGLTAGLSPDQDLTIEYRNRARRVIRRFLARLIDAARLEGNSELFKRLLSVYAITGDVRAWKNALVNAFIKSSGTNYERARNAAWAFLAESLCEDSAFEWFGDALGRARDAFAHMTKQGLFHRVPGAPQSIQGVLAREAAEYRDGFWKHRHVLVADRCLRSMEALERSEDAEGKLSPRPPHSPFAEEVRYLLVADPPPEVSEFLWEGK